MKGFNLLPKMILVSIVLLSVGLTGVTMNKDDPEIWMKIVYSIITLLGYILAIFSFIYWIGQPREKIYRFIYLYNQTDISDYQIEVIRELRKEDITRLKEKFSYATTKDLREFIRKFQIIKDTKQIVKINNKNFVKVTGWTVALYYDDAKFQIERCDFTHK